MQRRQFMQGGAVLAAAVLMPKLALAAKDKIFAGLVEGVGAGGYDVVAYFSGQSAIGKEDITAEWAGATWRFATVEHKAAFEAAPHKYAPQFGGYCAYAVANGSTAKGEPEAWTIVDGKLYLNFSKAVRTKWQEDVPGNIAAGNANWPKVLE